MQKVYQLEWCYMVYLYKYCLSDYQYPLNNHPKMIHY